MAPECEAVGSEPIQVRGAHTGVPERRQAIAAPLVRGDEEDVPHGFALVAGEAVPASLRSQQQGQATLLSLIP